MIIRLIIPLILFACTITAIIISFQYSISAAAGPWFLGGVAAILLLIIILKEIKGKRKMEETGSEKVKATGADFTGSRPYLELGIWVIGIVIAIYVAGMFIVFPLVVFTYMKVYKESWLLSIALSVVVFLIFLFFVQVFHINLYKGVLFE